MSSYVALLRGINVGGKNIIRMADLKACFEGLGFNNVSTYIQSGNVLFAVGRAGLRPAPAIEAALAERFSYKASVVLRTGKELQSIVARAPKGFGTKPAIYRYDVIFLKEPLTAPVAMKSVSAREGVDEAHAGQGVLYFSRLIAKAAQSHLTKLISQPVYKQMTIRNWNTTTRLLQLMGE